MKYVCLILQFWCLTNIKAQVYYNVFNLENMMTYTITANITDSDIALKIVKQNLSAHQCITTYWLNDTANQLIPCGGFVGDSIFDYFECLRRCEFRFNCYYHIHYNIVSLLWPGEQVMELVHFHPKGQIRFPKLIDRYYSFEPIQWRDGSCSLPDSMVLEVGNIGQIWKNYRNFYK
jgi:hypothetical protein